MAAALETLRPPVRRDPRFLPNSILLFLREPKDILTRLASAFIAALTFLMHSFLRALTDLYTRLDPTFLVALTLYFLQILRSLDGGFVILDPLRDFIDLRDLRDLVDLRRVRLFFPKPKRDNILILLPRKIIFKRIKLN
jgi:hypothetical protein